MNRPTFIGPESEAAGFRLMGVRVLVTDRREPAKLLREALGAASLVLVSAAAAGQLDSVELDAALLKGRPPVALLPELIVAGQEQDLEREVRAALGVL